MKKIIAMLLFSLILAGCTGEPVETTHQSEAPTAALVTESDETVPVETTVLQTTAPTPIETEEPVETEASSEPEITTIIVYISDENAEKFITTEVQGENLTVLEALIQAGVLNEDIKINSISQESSHLTVDFNAAFRDLVCTMGTSGERMIVGAVVNTFITAYKTETVSITVDGDIWESGHVVYDFPMGFFD